MIRLRWLLAVPAMILATSGPSTASEVIDKAGLFSPEAVKKAQAELDRIEGEYKVPVTVEAIPSLGGDPIREVTTRHAEQAHAKGMYVLIAKDESKIYAEPSHGYMKYLTKPRLKGVEDAFIAQFKKRDFDAGLTKGVEKIDSTLSEARTEAGGVLRPDPSAGNRKAAPGAVPAGRPRAANNTSWGVGSLLFIVIAILGVFLVIRIIGALFGAGRGGYANQGRMGGPGGGYGPGGPGYGAPGYGGGGGGGGFMSSMFGGIGGALAGNWLYDQFSGGRHHGVDQSTSYDPGAAAAPEAAPEWGEGGVGGDWGGDAGQSAGGDWGGGGGDAGGGDWGGGGGGDWGGGGGGGDDNGGSW